MRPVQKRNFTVRLPAPLREQLGKEASDRDLSVSELVTEIIAKHFDHPALIDALANRLEERLAEFERNNCAFDFIHVESGPVQ